MTPTVTTQQTTTQQTPPGSATTNHLLSGRMNYIDALRGFACFWVLLFHAFSGRHHPLPGSHFFLIKWFGTFMTLGYLGVNLFLVLSGFCLFYPLVKRVPVNGVHLDLLDFARRRFWRIVPAYYIALALFALLRMTPFGHDALGGFGGVRDVVMHLLLIHNFRLDTFSSINPVFWSLALEWQLYFLFPLLIVLARVRGMRAALAATLIVSVIYQFVIYHYFGMDPASRRVSWLYQALPGRCFEFAAGMAAAALIVRPVPNQARWALGVAAILLAIGVWHQLHVATFGPFADQVWGGAFACLILALRALQDVHFQRIGLLRGLVSLGGFSYSVYLVHLPLLHIISTETLLKHHIHLSGAKLAAFGLGRVFLMVAIGYVFFLVAEKPFFAALVVQEAARRARCRWERAITERRSGACRQRRGVLPWFPDKRACLRKSDYICGDVPWDSICSWQNCITLRKRLAIVSICQSP